jgi:hypothetical protein
VLKRFLRPQVWVFWILISLTQLIALALPRAALAAGEGKADVAAFSNVEISFTLSPTLPATGWTPTTLPANALSARARQGQNESVNAWVRFDFEPSKLGEQPLALYTENNRG